MHAGIVTAALPSLEKRPTAFFCPDSTRTVAPSISDPETVIPRGPTVSSTSIVNEIRAAVGSRRMDKTTCLSPSLTAGRRTSVSAPLSNSSGWNTSTPAPFPVTSKTNPAADDPRSITTSVATTAHDDWLTISNLSFGAPSIKRTLISADAEKAISPAATSPHVEILAGMFHRKSVGPGQEHSGGLGLLP